MSHTVAALLAVLAATSVQADTIFVSQLLFPREFAAGKIYEITPGGVRGTFAKGDYVNLAIDSSGNVFGAPLDWGLPLNTIDKFTPAGVRETFASGLNNPYGLAFDKHDNLFATAGGGTEIYKLTPSGGVNVFASVPSQYALSYLAIDRSGDLFADATVRTEDITGQDVIFEFNPAGMRSMFASGLNHPLGLAFNPSGDLFEIDTGSNHIYKFTPSGVRSVFASEVQPCCGLAFDSSGDLFESVPDTSGSIEEYTPNGVKRTFFSGFVSFGITSSPATVPEPGTWAVALLGFVTFGIRKRQLGHGNSRDLALFARHGKQHRAGG